ELNSYISYVSHQHRVAKTVSHNPDGAISSLFITIYPSTTHSPPSTKATNPKFKFPLSASLSMKPCTTPTALSLLKRSFPTPSSNSPLSNGPFHLPSISYNYPFFWLLTKQT